MDEFSLGKLLRLGVVFPFMGYLAFYLLVAPEGARAPSDTLRSQGVLKMGAHVEIVSVLISSSHCVAHAQPEFHDLVRAANQLLEVQASAAGFAFRRAGVSTDWNPREGVDYLLDLDDFDEITAGGNWLNVATQKYLLGSIPGVTSIPQMLLLARVVTTNEAGITVSDEQFLASHVGVTNLKRWVEDGAAFPLPTEHPSQ